ncbi:MAG: hypothetical protein SPJ62_16520 [Inconstantimicrobium porci]|uniref:hypothetical protein n=1 Tax=Inconstantimicrobium porci TaxID=2652291 RepID=UPI002A90D816|nr:hypothetical protein [Inconstantimicrobium porci]MDY5913568.1 hypothetical protein [Inconstantimicrobium porci]
MSTLIPVSSLEFRENVKIRFSNILDGLDNYNNFEIDGRNSDNGENEIINFLTEVFELNDCEAYVDLYLNNLDHEGEKNLLNLCCADDKEIITKQMKLNHDEPYYKVTNKSLIPFLARLNTREVFFVTFYFTKKPLTVWGNYNMSFPCFTENKEDLDFYRKIAKHYSLAY